MGDSPVKLPQEILRVVGDLEFARMEGAEYRFECPVCTSKNNLSVRWDTAHKREVIKCWSGCHLPRPHDDPPYLGYPELAKAIKARGGKLTAQLRTNVWSYKCDNGHVFQIVRMKDGGKRPRHLDPSSPKAKRGGWVWTAGTDQRPLYRADEVRKAISAGKIVRVCDGESDVEAFRNWRLYATTNPFGGSNWTEEHAKQLTGAIVEVYVDLDDKGSGYVHALNRYDTIAKYARSVRIRRPPEPKDVRDHFEKHARTPDEFIEMTREELSGLAAASGKRVTISAGSLSPELDSLAGALESGLGVDQLNPRDIAKRLYGQLNGLHYLHRSGVWRRWNGYCYEECETELRAQIIPTTVEVSRNRLLAEAGKLDPKQGLQRVLRQREYTFSRGSFPRELISLLSDFCWTDDELFDSDSSVLACESGILDREAAKLGEIAFLPHDSSRMISKYIPLTYDANSKCPEWEAFLRSSVPDGGVRLRMLIGFALCGDHSKKKHIVNLIGPPDTGKSTCLDILSRIIGPYLGTMRTDELTVSRHNAKFDFHGLRNSRAVFLAEPEPRSRFRVADLKRITGGEEITTEGKGTKPVRWRASVMPFIGTNFHINFDTRDDAFTDRLEYIEFSRTREIDRQLKRKLESELSGIFRWTLQGALDYFAGGLRDTSESLSAKKRAENAIEPPLQFIEYGLENGYIHEVSDDFPAYKCCAVGKLYSTFCGWWHDENPEVKPYGRKRFSEVVQKRYPTSAKSDGGGRITFCGLAPGASSPEE